MKKLILLVGALALAPLGKPQSASTGIPYVINSTGAPTGACAPNVLDVDRSTGLIYSCNGGAWILGSGATGPAGGSLTGTYPNPTIANGAVSFVMLNPVLASGTGQIFCTVLGTLTSTAIVNFDASGNCVASAVTVDGSGNISTPGAISTNVGGTNATVVGLIGGTQSLASSSIPTNSVGLIGPTSVTGKHFWNLGAVGASANNQFWLCSVEASSITNCTLTTLALTGDVTSVAQVTTLSSTFKQHSFGFSFDGAGSAISNNSLTVTREIPFACTIVGFNIAADTGTITIDVAKVATGTAIPAFPTNSITASATPALASGNNLHSTTLTGWTTSVALHDIVQAKVTAISGATKASLDIECNQ